MKTFLSLVLFLSSFPLWAAETCVDSDGGHNILKAGKVLYTLGDTQCLKDECFTQMIKEFDRCENESLLIEYSCSKNKMVEKKIPCPKQHKCHKGKCQPI